MAKEIHEVAKVKMEGDDPNVYVERAMELTAWMATTGHMLACAVYHRDKAVRESILSDLKAVVNLPSRALQELIKSSTAEENYLVNYIMQIDKDIKYQTDLLRSVISLKKTEITYINPVQ